MKTLYLIVALTVSLALTGAPHTLSTVPNPKLTDARAYVSNPDGILRPETVQEINVMLDSLAQTNQTEVALVVLQSIGDEVIENFAIELARSWGVGKAKDDNGLLILFVGDQRAVRFETGYGIEGVLPDALAIRIQEQSMFPYFKKGDFDRGFIEGIKHTVSVLKNEQFEAVKVEIPWGEIIPWAIGIYILTGFLTLLWVNAAANKHKKADPKVSNIARYKALKTEKSGIMLIMNILVPAIGVFIIILFKQPILLLLLFGIPVSTIPANIYGKLRMRSIRRQPIPCKECNGTMTILSEKKEDQYLKLSQQFEEQLHAVDYDVFVCKDCGNEAIFTLDKPSQYTECPKCKTKAFILHDRRVVMAPSYVNSGTERITYKCKFCGYEEHNNTKLPRLQRSTGAIVAGSAAGSLFSGRGGFGGGGGYGGGSFGGGSFGGGGATGRF